MTGSGAVATLPFARLPGHRRATIETAATVLVGLYERNVFPEMKVTWGTYPTNIGHDPFPGCLRCHDGEHKTRDGTVINDDCAVCHGIVAMDEANPRVLELLSGQYADEDTGDTMDE